MSKDAFKDRERAFEDEFFHRVDEKLLADLKAKLGMEQQVEALAQSTGLHDVELLTELVSLGLAAETVLAISLVPLVLVAWADGKVDASERSTLLAAAKEQGITDGTPAARMLKHWLNTKPDRQLRLTWMHYVQQIRNDISDEAFISLRDDFDRRTREIAKATGGTLGFGRISESEKSVIADLRQAFDA